MMRPLFPVALFYTAGLLIGNLWTPPLAWLFALSFTVLLAAAALEWRHRAPVAGSPPPSAPPDTDPCPTPPALALAYAAALIAAGWTNLATRTAILSPHDLRILVADRTESVAVRGRLAQPPEQRISVRRDRETVRTLAVIDVAALRRGDRWLPAYGRLVASTQGTLGDEFQGGQQVEVGGLVAPPEPPDAPGLFDYRAYLRRQGIHYQLRADSPGAWRAADPTRPPPWTAVFSRWAQRTLARGLPQEDLSLRLTWAMALGWKTGLTAEVSEPFMQSGTMHIFAISGLHIVLIAEILVALLLVARVPRGWCGLVAIPLIWFYTGATGWQASAIRSTVMMTLVIGGWALRRPGDLLNSLAAAAFIILVWDPCQLFQASFQLSFFVVLSLAMLVPPILAWTRRRTDPDPLLPRSLVPRWRRFLAGPIRWLLSAVATSVAAFLGSLPLIAHYFHLLTPVSLLANLIIVPLSSAALACNVGSLIAGDWFPVCTELLNQSAWFFMTCMVYAARACLSLPGAFFHVPSPGPLGFAAYYAVLLALLTGWALAPERRRAFACVTAGAALAFAAVALARAGVTRLVLLPVRGGDAIFATEGWRRRNLLVDGGDASSAQFITKPYLRAQGVNWIDHMALTHGDSLHVGGALDLARAFNPSRVISSPARFRSAAFRQLVNEMKAENRRVEPAVPGQALGSWEVLHPQPGSRAARADDSALVLQGTLRGTRILLVSDLSAEGQAALLARGTVRPADLLVAGLPANEEPLTDVLLDAARPRVILLSDTLRPGQVARVDAAAQRWRERGIQVFSTSTAGAIEIRFSRRGWDIRPWRGPQS